MYKDLGTVTANSSNDSLVLALGTRASVACMTGHIEWYPHSGPYQVQSKVEHGFVSVNVQQSKNMQNNPSNTLVDL